MKEFIIQYWVEVLFGLICAAIGFVAKRYRDLYKKAQEQKQNDLWDDIKKTISEDHNLLEKKIDAVNELSIQRETNVLQKLEDTNDNLNTMKKGILSVQGREFKKDCRKLLEDNHIITLTEYEQIRKDHNAYNLLGGNDNGDALFELVTIKYENSLNNK